LESLYFIYEKKYDVETIDAAFRKLAKYKTKYFWLTPPKNIGDITVVDILAAKTGKEHCELVHKWGKSVWDAWQVHHEVIIKFIERH